MKTLTLIACALILNAEHSIAQFPNFGAGVKGGLNLCFQQTTGEGQGVETSMLPAFHAGIYGNCFFIEQLAAQVELQYSQRGSKWNDFYFTGKDLLGYLDVPVLVRYQPWQYINIHAGPQIGFLLSAKQTPDQGDSYDVKEFYKSTDFSVVFGLEGNLPYNINVGIRYVRGLTDATTEVEYWEGWKNHACQFYLGYRIIGN